VKKLVFVALSFIVLDIGGLARAADVAVEPIYPGYGVPVGVAYNWTGFYIGGNVGAHFARDDIGTRTVDLLGNNAASLAIDAVSPTSLTLTGIIAGLQIGYNWQVGRLLLGLEVDGNWLGGTASRTLTNFPPPANPADVMTNTSKTQFLTTVRPRAGVVLDRWLLYVTGGLAFETFSTNDALAFAGGTIVAVVDKRSTRTGETIGGGFEYAVLDSWTLKLEYLYVNFGSFDVGILNAPITVHHQFFDNVARVGLNYRFPVYWKY
jgi:outer membrane immunogenic protein